MVDSKLSVVVVDDADDVRALVRTRLGLTKRFDVVAEAGNGHDAVAEAERHRPDLILLDVSMPGMDGLDAIGHIRAVSPSTTIVMFSGFDEEGLAARALQLGATDFVEKSVAIEQLAERLLAAAGRDGGGSSEAVDRSGMLDPVLQEHLERFGAAFDQAAIGMATLTLTGGIARTNAALAAIVATKAEELIGTPASALVGEAERAGFERALADVADGRADVCSIEHAVPTAGRWALSTIAVVRDSAGQSMYLLLQVQDVTDRRSAEAALRASEEQFRLLVEGVGDYAIFLLDPDGNVASWNTGAERAKGYRAEEIIGRHFSTFYTEADRRRGHPQEELEWAAADGRYEEEGWRVRKDGSQFWANVVITALRDHTGNLVGYAKVTRDVTDRKAAEAELAAANERLAGVAEERTQFLAVTAHELRTPVAVINGFASTLAEHWDDLPEHERLDMLAAITRGGERLSRMVDDLLTAARLEAGALEVWPSRFDLGALAVEAVGDLAGAGVSSIELVLPDEPVTAYADRGRVQQMLGNFLTNALRYGKAPVVVSVARTPEGAELRVSDRGNGIPDELRSRLFGRFARGASTDGTGLGLFIVRELARRQGGDAWHDDVPDGGASFAFRLPTAEM